MFQFFAHRLREGKDKNLSPQYYGLGFVRYYSIAF